MISRFMRPRTLATTQTPLTQRDEIADKPQTLMRRAGPAVTAFRWNGVSINNACVVYARARGYTTSSR